MKRILAIALGLSLLTTACADPVAPPAPTPVAPTITDTYPGTLLQLGSNTHPFNVQQVGGVKVTISNVTPKVTIGFGVGTQSLTGCTIIKDARATAGATTELSGTTSIAGTFCVSVFDTGEVVDPITYTVTILHS
jgi:hypothetical protein